MFFASLMPDIVARHHIEVKVNYLPRSESRTSV
jgi:hypothetical protein